MKKLRLELDALRVESFETRAAPEARGTVHGQVEETGGGRVVMTCEFLGTCAYESCMGDCMTGGGEVEMTCEFLGTCGYRSCMNCGVE